MIRSKFIQLFSIILIFISFQSISAQIDTTKVAFVAYWSIGDSYDFNVTEVEKRWKNGELVKNDSSRYTANFKIIDSTATSYKIQWTHNNFIKKSLNNNLDKILDEKKEIDSIIKQHDVANIIYETDEMGEFLQVLNWEEIRDLFLGLFDQMKVNLRKEHPEKINKIERLLNPLIEIYSSKESIEQVFLEELQYFHYPFGIEYEIDRPIVYEQDFPNIVGDKPLTGEATLTFQSVDFENFFCVFKEEVVLNPEEAIDIVTVLLKKMGFKKKEVNKMYKDAFLNIQDHNTYEYHYDPGVPHRIEAIRELNLKLGEDINGYKKILTIELIYEE